MKKFFKLVSILMVLLMALSMMAACGSKEEATTEESKEETTEEDALGAPEVTTVKWNSGTSKNVLITIANEKGYFEDEGITIEEVPADENNSAMALLASGKVDVVSNAGTSNPLDQISQGVDLTIFGGHMVQGAMPIIAKKGTKWNGVQDFVGKKVVANTSYFALTGAVMNLGEEKPLEAVEWIEGMDYPDALAMVERGEADYALQGTGNVQTCKESGTVDIVTWQGDIMPDYSCCRMVAQTEFVKNNPNTLKHVMVALLRAQAYYEANKEEAVKLHAAATEQTEDYVAAFMLDEHYKVNVDPLEDSVLRAWNILDATGFFKDKDDSVKIEDHINTDLYKEALDYAEATYGEEDPDFYKAQQDFFAENNTGTAKK
ncbi:MAG: ABC transporter substrate-binding protein [Lachnospiraceae bacterium]|nr:ABC transporter substrate-binding protein [Lachnospiraceae bacterium]MBQ6353437.1 ABC transporter substrate-binding protein [Lachnospiraceae bacterium]